MISPKFRIINFFQKKVKWLLVMIQNIPHKFLLYFFLEKITPYLSNNILFKNISDSTHKQTRFSIPQKYCQNFSPKYIFFIQDEKKKKGSRKKIILKESHLTHSMLSSIFGKKDKKENEDGSVNIMSIINRPSSKPKPKPSSDPKKSSNSNSSSDKIKS